MSDEEFFPPEGDDVVARRADTISQLLFTGDQMKDERFKKVALRTTQVLIESIVGMTRVRKPLAPVTFLGKPAAKGPFWEQDEK